MVGIGVERKGVRKMVLIHISVQDGLSGITRGEVERASNRLRLITAKELTSDEPNGTARINDVFAVIHYNANILPRGVGLLIQLVAQNLPKRETNGQDRLERISQEFSKEMPWHIKATFMLLLADGFFCVSSTSS